MNDSRLSNFLVDLVLPLDAGDLRSKHGESQYLIKENARYN